MITVEIMETAAKLAMCGVKVVVQPDGSMVFETSHANTRALRNMRYRDRLKASQSVSDTSQSVLSSPSPSPSFLPSSPSPNPPSPTPIHTPLSAPPPVQRARKVALPVDDETWLHSLELNVAYAGIGIRQELGKCQAWCSVRNTEASRKRFVNWLNNAHKPIAVNGINKPKHPAYNASTATQGLTRDEVLNFTDES